MRSRFDIYKEQSELLGASRQSSETSELCRQAPRSSDWYKEDTFNAINALTPLHSYPRMTRHPCIKFD